MFGFRKKCSDISAKLPEQDARTKYEGTYSKVEHYDCLSTDGFPHTTIARTRMSEGEITEGELVIAPVFALEKGFERGLTLKQEKSIGDELLKIRQNDLKLYVKQAIYSWLSEQFCKWDVGIDVKIFSDTDRDESGFGGPSHFRMLGRSYYFRSSDLVAQYTVFIDRASSDMKKGEFEDLKQRWMTKEFNTTICTSVKREIDRLLKQRLQNIPVVKTVTVMPLLSNSGRYDLFNYDRVIDRDADIHPDIAKLRMDTAKSIIEAELEQVKIEHEREAEREEMEMDKK